MINRLDPIIAQKQLEVNALKSKKSFKQALCQPTLAVIAEIKRLSPSKGALAEISDPVALAQTYVKGGAQAISILTDERFFGGKIEDLIAVSRALQETSVPILRKDFIVDKIQIAQSAMIGADAILCIVAVLGHRTKEMLAYAREWNLDVLVEVHDEAELDIALECGADIIGINNRNLTTFEVDVTQSLTLVKKIPEHIIKVAESGITEPLLARQYHQAGFHAVLMGEVLVKSAQPDVFIQACCHAD